MTLKAFSPIPAWISPFSTVPRCQLITLYTHEKRQTLGRMSHHHGQQHWQPTAWGKAITGTLELMTQHEEPASIKAFTVMPNHVHIFVLYKKYHAKLPSWFIGRLKKFLSEQMKRQHAVAGPIWEEEASAQLVYTETAQYAIVESLREAERHWKYDPWHTTE